MKLYKLILTIIRNYFVIYPHIWILVALSSAAHLIVPWFFVLNPAYGLVAFIGFVLLTWFFYTAILNTSQVALQGGHMKLKAAFRLSRQRYLYILGSNLLFFAIGALLIVFEYGLNLLFDLVHQFPIFVGLIVIINVYIFVRLYFAIPLIVLDHGMRIWAAFVESFQMVRHHWWQTSIVLFLVAMVILGFEALGILVTGKDRMVLFTLYHFLLQMLFYPLIISATLVLYRDLKPDEDI